VLAFAKLEFDPGDELLEGLAGEALRKIATFSPQARGSLLPLLKNASACLPSPLLSLKQPPASLWLCPSWLRRRCPTRCGACPSWASRPTS
jgi:hypothetical protein